MSNYIEENININNTCQFCSKEFSSKVNLLQHQRTVKNCLKLQGKQNNETEVECENCKKILSIKYYKQHKIKCDDKYIEIKEKEKEKELKEIEKYKLENEKYKLEIQLLEKEKEIDKEERISVFPYS